MQASEARPEDARVGSGFNVFSTVGRISRLQFAYSTLLGVIGLALCSAGMALCRFTAITIAVCAAIVIMLFIAWAAAAVRRFHDLNRHGLDLQFLLIPGYNLYVLIQLFFSRPKTIPYLSPVKQSNAHYWQVPVVILLVPALFFGMGAEHRMSRAKPVFSLNTWHEYDSKEHFSADVAYGEGFGGSFPSVSEKPFSQYTQEDFAELRERYGTPEAIGKVLSFNARNVTDFTYRLDDINGKKFVHVTFADQVIDKVILFEYVIGIYDGTEYRFDAAYSQDEDLLTRYYIQKAYQSLRVGKDAIP